MLKLMYKKIFQNFYFSGPLKSCTALDDLRSEEKIEDIQIFGMNMTFITSSEAKNAYFMSGEATNEIYIFLASRDEINGIFIPKI